LKTAALIICEIPDVKFLLVGRGASDEFRMKLYESNLAGNTILTGFREDVPRMLAAMDVSINVSTRGEGLTGAMRESLAMKKAVVCTDVGGNRELMRDGETARLVPARDPRAMADAIIYLLRNPLEAQRLAENGYALIQREFTREKALDRLEEIYRCVVEGRELNS
jgi:glycosyltransferase involved in cell wall biosynthesis